VNSASLKNTRRSRVVVSFDWGADGFVHGPSIPTVEEVKPDSVSQSTSWRVAELLL